MAPAGRTATATPDGVTGAAASTAAMIACPSRAVYRTHAAATAGSTPCSLSYTAWILTGIASSIA